VDYAHCDTARVGVVTDDGIIDLAQVAPLFGGVRAEAGRNHSHRRMGGVGIASCPPEFLNVGDVVEIGSGRTGAIDRCIYDATLTTR